MHQSPTACRPLADWLGQSVRFQGWLNYWETASKTGDTALLLRNVEVVPYKGCKEQIRVLDHVWIYLSKESHAGVKLERLGGYEALGQVVSYTRSNGTRDFAFAIKSYIPIETQLKLLKSFKGPRLDDVQTRTMLLKETLELLETEELEFSIRLSYEDVYRRFQDEYEFCYRQVEINERYQAQQPPHCRPNTQIVKFGSTASKSTKVAGKGFATS